MTGLWITLGVVGLTGLIVGVSWLWAAHQHRHQMEAMKVRRAEMEASWKLQRQTMQAFSEMLRASRADRIRSDWEHRRRG